MEFDLSKLWMTGGGLLVGAISGAWIWAQHASSMAHQAAEKLGGDDALIQTATTVGTSSLAAALQGAAVGGALGIAAVVAYLYFADPDRAGMKVRAISTGDDEFTEGEGGLTIKRSRGESRY